MLNSQVWRGGVLARTLSTLPDKVVINITAAARTA